MLLREDLDAIRDLIREELRLADQDRMVAEKGCNKVPGEGHQGSESPTAEDMERDIAADLLVYRHAHKQAIKQRGSGNGLAWASECARLSYGMTMAAQRRALAAEAEVARLRRLVCEMEGSEHDGV